MTGVEQWLLPKVGVMNPPWTLHHTRPDHVSMLPAERARQIMYPKSDARLTFDRLSSVFVSNTNHADDQPAHLTLKDVEVPVSVNLARYAGPESRYCPTGVYEFVNSGNGAERLQINAQRTCAPACMRPTRRRSRKPTSCSSPACPGTNATRPVAAPP